jgi:glycosyltransferase involved in cell wall biosynthesis
MVRQALSECRAVVTMFPRTYFDIEQVVGVTANNLFLLEAPLLVKPARGSETARAASASPRLLYPAQFQVHKNHMGLLRGLRAYLDRGKEAELVFTGSDFVGEKVPLRVEIQALAEELGLSERVKVAGKVDEAELTRLYRECDGMLVGSLAEGGGYVPLEGIYAGLPVAAHDLRATRMHAEMYGAEIRYFDSTDPSSTADAIEWIATVDRSRLARVNEAARDAIDARSWRGVAAAMMRIIDWVNGIKPRPILSLAPGSAEVRLQ